MNILEFILPNRPDTVTRIRALLAKTPPNTCPFCWGSGLVDAIRIGDPYNYEVTFICDCSDGFPRNREPVYAGLKRWSSLLHGKYAVKGHKEYDVVLKSNLEAAMSENNAPGPA